LQTQQFTASRLPSVPALAASSDTDLAERWFDDIDRVVVVRGDRRPVRPLTWHLLTFLRRHLGRNLSTSALEDRLLEFSRAENPNAALRIHMHLLRQALRDTPYRLLTLRDVGYCLECIAAPSLSGAALC
jgi:two-component system, OmpR family, response regulator